MQTVKASEAVRQGQEFFRVKQSVKTIGFGVEFDVSTKAISVGPDSDFSEYSVIYFDPTKNLVATLATITPQRPFIGRLDAREDLSPSGLVLKTVTGLKIENTGRLIVVPENNFDLTTEISPAIPTKILNPTVDLIGYTGVPSQVPTAGRSDFHLNFAPKFAAGIQTAYLLPFYGRKSFTITNRLSSAIINPLVAVNGLKYTDTYLLVDLVNLVVDTTAQFNFHYETTSEGQFDFIEILITATDGFNPEDELVGYRFIFNSSDEVGGS